LSAHYWTVTGLSVDIVGALLLSVEAIRLENIRKVRDTLSRIPQYLNRPDVRDVLPPIFMLCGIVYLLISYGGEQARAPHISLPLWVFLLLIPACVGATFLMAGFLLFLPKSSTAYLGKSNYHDFPRPNRISVFYR
jgi:hypothetical protein